MYKLGLKLWSINTDNYLKEAIKLYNQGIYDYIELYVVPGSLEHLSKWETLKFSSFGDSARIVRNEFPSPGGVPDRAGWLSSNLGEISQSSSEEFPSPEGVARSAGNEFPSPGGVARSAGVVRNTKNYKQLPYNPDLKERAKELRKAGNLSEVLLWNEIKNKKFKGLDFDRQKIIGNYIVDFYCASQNVVIEIDGESHAEKKEYDLKRDNFLKSFNLQVIHIFDSDVKKNLDGVMEFLNNHPALSGTPPREGNEHPALSDYKPMNENDHPSSSGTPPKEGNDHPEFSMIFKDEKQVLNIPFIIHCPHFAHGFNLAKKEKKDSNKKIFKEVQEFADALEAPYIVIHGGIDGDIRETATQLADFNESRALIENKPFVALPNKMGGNFCRGYNVEEIKIVQDISGCGFCLDFGHAICAANSLQQEPYSYIEQFLQLNPDMFHLTDVSDMTSVYDSHPHLGTGQLDIKKVLNYIPDNKHITLETVKTSKDNVDDFINDCSIVKQLEIL